MIDLANLDVDGNVVDGCPFFSSTFLPVVRPTERCGRQHNVLTRIPASNGLRDGLTWDLIPNVLSEELGRAELGFVE